MAVNTKNLNDLVKEISNELQQLQGDLMETTEVFKQRREVVEKHCWQCQDLFKPWPCKVVQLYCPEIQADQKLDETEEKPSCASITEPEIEKEKQELAMLDDILAKAHHARDIQNKMSKPAKKSAKAKPSSLPTSQVKEAKPKPKVSYPVLKRPSSAKSTYSASYTKPTAKAKTLGTGAKKTSSTSKVHVTSRPEPKRQPERNKATTAVKSHEAKRTVCESLSKTTISHVVENATSLKPQSKERGSCEASTNASTTETKFLISEKGSTLNMPTEFREICKEHKKLLRRIQKAKTFTPRPSEDQFVKREEGLFCSELRSLPSVLELKEEADRLQKEYRALLGFVKVKNSSISSAKDATQLDSDWSDEGGTVMSKFEKLNQEAKGLKESLDFLSKRCPFPKHKSVVFGENWEGELPSGFTGPKYSKTDPDGCFSYHSMKELKAFIGLSYDYQIMKLQFDLRKIVGDTLLPLLQKLPANHKSFGPLSRLVYSILCCEGKTFPAMVKDSLPED